MRAHYHYGRSKEKRVARQLSRKGYRVKVSKGSKGASDIQAQKGSKKWAIQVKATRLKRSTQISPTECRKLKIQARKIGAIPVHAKVIRNKIRYISVRTRKELKP